MKPTLASTLLFCVVPVIAGQKYFLSTAGNDLWDGASPSTPWRSISKMNATISQGDSVFFRRGDVFRDSAPIRVKSSLSSSNKTVYSHFGNSSEPPEINGAKLFTGNWSVLQGSVYKAKANTFVWQVILNGKPMILAKYPNSGYLTNQVESETTITSSTILPNFTGASIHFKIHRSILQTREVASHASYAINLDSRCADNYSIDANAGFFLNNHLTALDTVGEWYYDKISDSIYIWTPNGDSPANYQVELSTFPYGLTSNANDSNILIDGLRFANQADTAICLKNGGRNIDIIGNEILNAGQIGMFLIGTNYSVQRNQVRSAVRTGIFLDILGDINTSSEFMDNLISETGAIDRFGSRGIQRDMSKGNALFLFGDSNIVSGNRIENTAFNGIYFTGNDAIIEKNNVSHSCMVMDDCAGIYTVGLHESNWIDNMYSTDGSKIRNNIVRHSVGNYQGTGHTYTSGHGIYIDDMTKNVEVRNNYIFDNDVGIYVHNTRNITVVGNVSYDNRERQLLVRRDGNLSPTDTTKNNRADSNTLFSKSPIGAAPFLLDLSISNHNVPIVNRSDNFDCMESSSQHSCTIGGSFSGATYIVAKAGPYIERWPISPAGQNWNRVRKLYFSKTLSDYGAKIIAEGTPGFPDYLSEATVESGYGVLKRRILTAFASLMR